MSYKLRKLKGYMCILFYKMAYGKRVSMPSVMYVRGKLNIDLEGSGTCKIGERLNSKGPLNLLSKGELVVGDDCGMNTNVSIACHNNITIGHNCNIGNNVVIVDHNHLRKDGVLQDDEFEIGTVKIGDHVWLGANSVILMNSSIGDNSVVAAGAVVNMDVPENCIVAGVPAKVVKNLNT